jgi:hypothetical protein
MGGLSEEEVGEEFVRLNFAIFTPLGVRPYFGISKTALKAIAALIQAALHS